MGKKHPKAPPCVGTMKNGKPRTRHRWEYSWSATDDEQKLAADVCNQCGLRKIVRLTDGSLLRFDTTDYRGAGVS